MCEEGTEQEGGSKQMLKTQAWQQHRRPAVHCRTAEGTQHQKLFSSQKATENI